MKAPILHVESPAGRKHLRIGDTERHRTVAEILRRHGLPLNTRCGQRGTCNGCVIELLDGELMHVPTNQIVASNGTAKLLRGCEHRPCGSAARIRLTARGLLAYQPQVLTDFNVNVPRAHDPLIQRLAVTPAQMQNLAEVLQTDRPVRLAEGLVAPPCEATITVEHRGDHWRVTAVEAQPPVTPLLGAAIDIGTTTVAVLLVDLADGKVLSRAACFNQQMHLGDDVVTRITLCASDPANVAHLQEAVAQRTVGPLLTEALRRAGAAAESLACLSVVGNTTMLHLLAGVDPTPMGVAPFTAPFLEHRALDAGQILPDIAAPRAPLHLLPSAAAYIGADLTAGILASGLAYDDGPSLLVDVGTNGEIILKHEGRLYGCATAAGPAFEGAGLACGIRAGDGAISHLRFTADPFAVEFELIGEERHVRPAGLCGSAYVDFLSLARRSGVLGATGRFNRSVGQAAARIMPAGNDLAFRIADAPGGRGIVITQHDVAALLQAKAAIAAGIVTLLQRCGVGPAEIRTLYLAGGFGTHLSPEHAIGCGLLPGFRLEQIRPVGNSALAGAYAAMLDATLLEEISRISRQIEVVELNLDPRFEENFIEQLALP